MSELTSAFCLNPFPLLPHINKMTFCDGIRVYVKDDKCYVWYTNSGKVFPDAEHRQVEQKIIEFIKKNFNDNGAGLQIIFSRKDISYFLAEHLEHIMLDNLINGEYESYDIANFNENVIIPPESTGPKTWQEIVQFCRENLSKHLYSIYDNERIIVMFLPYFHAREFLSIDMYESDWNDYHRIAYEKKEIIKKMRELSKVYLNHRFGLKSLCWLLADDYPSDNIHILQRYIVKNYLN